MEYVPKKNLYHIIKKSKGMNENDAFKYFIQTVAGIYFMHKHDLIHRDIKPENLLVNENTQKVKICDFGWTTQTDVERDSTGLDYE